MEILRTTCEEFVPADLISIVLRYALPKYTILKKGPGKSDWFYFDILTNQFVSLAGQLPLVPYSEGENSFIRLVYEEKQERLWISISNGYVQNEWWSTKPLSSIESKEREKWYIFTYSLVLDNGLHRGQLWKAIEYSAQGRPFATTYGALVLSDSLRLTFSPRKQMETIEFIVTTATSVFVWGRCAIYKSYDTRWVLQSFHLEKKKWTEHLLPFLNSSAKARKKVAFLVQGDETHISWLSVDGPCGFIMDLETLVVHEQEGMASDPLCVEIIKLTTQQKKFWENWCFVPWFPVPSFSNSTILYN